LPQLCARICKGRKGLSRRFKTCLFTILGRKRGREVHLKPQVEIRAEINKLRNKSFRLRKRIENHEKSRNFPMAKACLRKKKKIDTKIRNFTLGIPEKVSFD